MPGRIDPGCCKMIKVSKNNVKASIYIELLFSWVFSDHNILDQEFLNTGESVCNLIGSCPCLYHTIETRRAARLECLHHACMSLDRSIRMQLLFLSWKQQLGYLYIHHFWSYFAYLKKMFKNENKGIESLHCMIRE